jgi:hypothetical protein
MKDSSGTFNNVPNSKPSRFVWENGKQVGKNLDMKITKKNPLTHIQTRYTYTQGIFVSSQ